MSQSSFLDDLAQWSPEQCRQNIDKALPKLVKQVRDSTGHDLLSLKLLCELFLPSCQSPCVERDVFSVIHQRVIVLCDTLYEEVCSGAKRLSGTTDRLVQQQLTALLQTCLELVTCMDLCVSAVLQMEGLEMSLIHSLSRMVLHVIKGSYSHCKDSGQIYGEFLSVITDQLSAIFKKTHALQMNFISLLDKVAIDGSDADINDICAVLKGFHDISLVAVTLDVKIMIVMWKTISRLACQHRALLYNRLDIDPMLASLATDMTSSFGYLQQIISNSQQTDSKAFSKSVKVLGFQMKVLVTLVKEYGDCLEHSVIEIIKLLLAIQGQLPPSRASTEIPRPHVEEIQKTVAVATETLVSHLVPHRLFTQTLTASEREGDFDEWIALCMTLVTVAEMLANHPVDVHKSWISPQLYPEDVPRQPILSVIFSTLPKCFIELSSPTTLPGVMCQGKPQRTVSFYEHICTRLCAFVACFPQKYFGLLEQCLLENVLSCNVHNAILAGDLWCFLVRYGSASLCRDHCLLLAGLLSSSGLAPTARCCHLVITLRRLIKFLAPEHQESFLRTFPVVNHLPLYSLLPLAVFEDALVSSVACDIVKQCVQSVSAWLEPSPNTVAHAACLTELFAVVANLCSYPDLVQGHVSVDLQTTLLTGTCRCILTLTPSMLNEIGAIVFALSASAVKAVSYLSHLLDNQLISQLLELFSSWLELTSLPTNVKLAIVYFLQGLGPKTFVRDPQQADVLQRLPQVFGALLSDSNVVVHQMTLETFAQFAEETAHETIVPDSLNTDGRTESAVVAYLNKLAHGAEEMNCNLSILKAQQSLLQKNLRASTDAASDDVKQTEADEIHHSITEEPSPKRQRLDTSQDICRIEAAIASMKTEADALTDLHSSITIPTSLIGEIQQIQKQLAAITGPS